MNGDSSSSKSNSPSHQYSSSQPMLIDNDHPENGRVRSLCVLFYPLCISYTFRNLTIDVRPLFSCRRSLEHLHIAPFIDTLDANEEKEYDADSVVNTYLKPYFQSSEGKNLSLRAQNRLIINKVEFKVLAVYPPKGIVLVVPCIPLSVHVVPCDDPQIRILILFLFN